MIRVLEFIGDPLVYGGQEEFVLNMLSNFSSDEIKCTVCTPFYCENEKLIKVIERRDEKLLALNYNVNGELRKIRVVKALKKVLSKNDFDVVHIHAGSMVVLFKCARLAKRMGIKNVIVHSHMAGNLSFITKLLKKYTDKFFGRYADNFLACSLLAGKCKFPYQILNSEKFRVIPNGIDTSKFSFDIDVRNQYRKEFQIENDTVLLNVGRFTEQKNQQFIVNVVKQLRNKLSNFKVILVGDGKLKKQIMHDVESSGLKEYFIFLEKRNDIQNIMMASDVFLFPSVFEGLGIVAIEAQATGLPVIASEFVPQETNFTDLYYSVPLNENTWLKLVETIQYPTNRFKYADIAKQSGYDAKQSALMLESLYLGE